MEIVPAVLEKEINGFTEVLGVVSGFATRVQVDFNDGSFAGFTSVRAEEAAPVIKNFADKLMLEAHLMVQRPKGDKWLAKLREAGFRKFIIQYEIEEDIREVLEELQRMDDVLSGIAIGPETSVYELEPYVDMLDTITVMDIEPGKQGQKFMPAELAKIRELKEGFAGEVQADGAITEETIQEVIEAQPDTLVVGSSIVKAANPLEAYESLLRLIQT